MKDMNEKEINEQYNKLMETTKLTDEQIDKIAKTLDEVPEAADTILYNKAISEPHETMCGEKTIGSPVVNVGTGMLVGANSSLNINKDIDMDDIMDLDKIQVDYTNTEITPAAVEAAIEGIATGVELDNDDILKLSELAKQKLDGKTLNWYANLPEKIKELIDQISAQGAAANGNKNLKAGRQLLAGSLLDTIGAKGVMNTAQKDLNAAMENTLEKLNCDAENMFNAFFNMQMEQYTVNYPEQADIYEKAIENGEIKDEDISKIKHHIELYRGISHSFIQSYMYEDMLDAYKSGKIKIKKIQIDKFERTMQEFDFKYSKINIGIDTVVSIVPIIARMVGDDASPNAVKKFIVMFVNYTKNMKPENIVDHTFMYYFIKHIISTIHFNHRNQDEVKFYSELTERIVNIVKMLDAE